MTDVKAFADTNILLYLVSGDAMKADKAEQVLSGKPVISVQVLNEFANAARRKFKMGWEEIADIVAVFRKVCEIVPLTVDIHESARRMAARYQTSFYDAVIIASALYAGCKVLFSEDMQDGLLIERELRIRNPFA